jgi:hypothetical protein
VLQKADGVIATVGLEVDASALDPPAGSINAGQTAPPLLQPQQQQPAQPLPPAAQTSPPESR